MRPHYQGEAGMFFLPAYKHPKCVSCREYLVKKHGLVQDGEGHTKEPYQVIGWYLGHTGPRCIWCHQQSWTDQEFWRRTGHSDDTAYRWQGDLGGPFNEQAQQLAKKAFPDVPKVKRDTLD